MSVLDLDGRLAARGMDHSAIADKVRAIRENALWALCRSFVHRGVFAPPRSSAGSGQVILPDASPPVWSPMAAHAIAALCQPIVDSVLPVADAPICRNHSLETSLIRCFEQCSVRETCPALISGSAHVMTREHSPKPVRHVLIEKDKHG